MASSETDLCNLALAHLANGNLITSLTERSAEARACNQFYAQVRDEVLRDAPWPCTTTFADLAMVEEDPTEEWAFSYREPADCLVLRRIRSGLTRNDDPTSRVPWRKGSDTQGGLIYTDQSEATCEYSRRESDVTRYPPDLVQAIAALLATYIAPKVTGGDQFKLGGRAFQLYQALIARARANMANESQPDLEPDSPSIAARN